LSCGILILVLWTKAKDSANAAPEEIYLPRDADIVKLSAMVVDLPHLGINGVPKFDVPPDYINVILGALRPAIKNKPIDKWGPPYVPIGELWIFTKAPWPVRVVFYDIGNGPAAFTIDGVSGFRGGRLAPVFVSSEYESYEGESVLICKALKEMYLCTKKNPKSNKLTRYIENLRRSRGEIPPEKRP
jgi:hypothetical protein